VIFSIIPIMPVNGAIQEEYEWNNVAIGGGGYVTGLVIHPAHPNVVYARTDVGGAYRWDESDKRWIPLMDMYGMEQQSYYSVDSIATDPTSPNVVYAAVGRKRSLSYAVLKSTDQGRSWKKAEFIGKDVGIFGNGDYRWGGERLAIDPNKPSLIYFGTREDGLWKSTDAGESFAKVESF
jgi:xyloglucan-specific exo-beta-1,4-glucanase